MTMPYKLVDESQAPVRFYDAGISAGFPSPAQDCEEPRLHLNDLLIKNPDTTFVTKANGDSIIGAGIHNGDMPVVDRGLTNYKDKVVIACINGEFTVKRYKIERGRPVLKPQNPK
jgi:DNA polymerase V